ARANHTGAQPASTISDFSPTVKTILQQYGLTEKIRDIPEGQLNGLSANTFTFCRPAGAGVLPSQVNHYVIHLQLNDAGFAMQIAVNFLSGKSYSRIKDNGNWQAQWVAGIAKGDYGVGSKDDAPFVGVNQNPDTYLTGGYAVGQFTILGASLTGVLITQAGSNATAASQQFVDWASGKMYSRGKSSNAWSPWRSLLAAGDFGVGATNLVTCTDANAVAANGDLLVYPGTLNGPNPGVYGTLRTSFYDKSTGNWTQLILSTANNKMFYRGCVNGAIQSWMQVNEEFITNANGSAIKFSDGTMICWNIAPTRSATTIGAGNVWVSPTFVFTFPAAFVVAPLISVGAVNSPNGSAWGSSSYSTATECRGAMFSAYNGLEAYPQYIAIGRWR
ncbi:MULTISPECIES: pyocin knob domain-containing protein, partial [unclassified Pseudomonas]